MVRIGLLIVVTMALMSQACDETEPVAPTAGSIVEVNELRPDPVSGSRLQARVLDLGDSDLLIDWWDRELGLACTFVPTPDGEMRCLPSAVASDRWPLEAARDGQCTYVYTLNANGPVRVRTSVAEEGSTTCEGSPTWEAYEIKAPDSKCPAGEPDVLVLGKRLTLERFVRAIEVSEHTDARLGLSVLLAEDGARQVLAAHDRTLDARCSPQHIGEDGYFTCVPSLALTYGVSLNPRCEGKQVYLPLSDRVCDGSNRFGFDGSQVYSLQSPVKPPFYEYRDNSDDVETCGRVSSAKRELAYPLGDPLAAASLSVDYLGKPVGRLFLFKDRQPLLPYDDYGDRFNGFDHERGEVCTFLPMSSGDWMCLPYSIRTVREVFFEDAKCTKPVLSSFGSRVMLVRAVDAYLPTVPQEEGVNLVDLGEEVDATFYQLYSDGTCWDSGRGFRRFRDAVDDLPKLLPIQMR